MGNDAKRSAKRVDNKGRKLPDGFSQRKDGRYQARFTVCGKRYTIYDNDLSALKVKFIEKKNEINNMVFMDKVSMKLNDWFDKWLEVYKRPKIKDSTLDLYARYWNSYFRDRIGIFPIHKLKRIQVVQLYNEMLADGFEIGTVRLANQILRSCLKQAVYNDYLYRNPTDGVMKELAYRRPRRRDAISISQQKKFLNYVGQSPDYHIYLPLFIIGFGTGLRISEICGLLWDDVDFSNDIINVNKIVTYSKYAWEGSYSYKVSLPKTDSSKRNIPMLPEVREAFELQRKYQEALHIKSMKIAGLTGFVFMNSRGKPYYENMVNSLIRKIVSSYNAEERLKAEEENRAPEELKQFSTHIMRHTFASRCYESDLRSKTIQKLLGHSNIETTENIYIHCSDDMVKEEMKMVREKGIHIL